MAAQQPNFEQADAIPTKDLPNTTVHWLFVTLGVGAIGIGVAGLATRSRALLSSAAVLGVVVIATTLLLLAVPAKTRAVDELTAAFRPVFTAQGAAQARGYVDTLEAMHQQLTTQALPGVADALGVTPEQLGARLPTSRPSPPACSSCPPSSLASMPL